MLWTLFVLDFDVTYNNEDWDSSGVQPSVYLIPLKDQREVERCTVMAGEVFANDKETCLCIGDYFERFLDSSNISYRLVGNIDLTFGERQVDYLVDYIPRESV